MGLMVVSPSFQELAKFFKSLPSLQPVWPHKELDLFLLFVSDATASATTTMLRKPPPGTQVIDRWKRHILKHEPI